MQLATASAVVAVRDRVRNRNTRPIATGTSQSQLRRLASESAGLIHSASEAKQSSEQLRPSEFGCNVPAKRKSSVGSSVPAAHAAAMPTNNSVPVTATVKWQI